MPETSSGFTNPQYYAYRPTPGFSSSSSQGLKSKKPKSKRSTRSAPGPNGSSVSRIGSTDFGGDEDNRTLVHRKEFEKFHAENGVRTVIGQIGAVKGGTVYSFLPIVIKW